MKSRKKAIIDATLLKSSCRPRKVVEDILEDRHEEDNDESKITYSKDVDASWLKKGNRHIMYKEARNTPLTGFQKLHNKAVSKIRYVVEQPIGLLKLHFGYSIVVYRY